MPFAEPIARPAAGVSLAPSQLNSNVLLCPKRSGNEEQGEKRLRLAPGAFCAISLIPGLLEAIIYTPQSAPAFILLLGPWWSLLSLLVLLLLPLCMFHARSCMSLAWRWVDRLPWYTISRFVGRCRDGRPSLTYPGKRAGVAKTSRFSPLMREEEEKNQSHGFGSPSIMDQTRDLSAPLQK